MEELGTDPLNIRLCKIQESFRAQLNPKQWRCGIKPQRINYPWEDDTAEQSTLQWIAAHEKKAQEYATGSLIGQFGSKTMDTESARVAELQDSATKAESGNLNRPAGCPPECDIRLCSLTIECCEKAGNKPPMIEALRPLIIHPAGDTETILLRTIIEDQDNDPLVYQWVVNDKIISVGESSGRSSASLILSVQKWNK